MAPLHDCLLQGVLESLRRAAATLRAAVSARADRDHSNLSVTVKLTTANQKAIEKLERKAARKAKGKAAPGRGTVASADVEYACNVGWAALQVRS